MPLVMRSSLMIAITWPQRVCVMSIPGERSYSGRLRCMAVFGSPSNGHQQLANASSSSLHAEIRSTTACTDLPPSMYRRMVSVR